MAQPLLVDTSGPVVVVAGDSPLIQASSIRGPCSIISTESAGLPPRHAAQGEPQGLGRIVREAQGEFVGDRRGEKDATDEQQRITEVDMSTYIFSGPELLHALELLKNDNRQKEYYLTDCPGILQSRRQAGAKRCRCSAVRSPEH